MKSRVTNHLRPSASSEAFITNSTPASPANPFFLYFIFFCVKKKRRYIARCHRPSMLAIPFPCFGHECPLPSLGSGWGGGSFKRIHASLNKETRTFTSFWISAIPRIFECCGTVRDATLIFQVFDLAEVCDLFDFCCFL